ncbi:hypothetical protein N7U66_06955 [Lacinutrix neustonica]|uniref:Uncharacterized protein n=1 Tax=Lacinutrix neustonica TaxID=2980107 RepID=A0A9E8MXQ4_9FLAO|nr:hypothetical protein [Lacinutrix neustonica]WAC03296.1 hypothetical protein N7U66_06955 [Lacinutrix neustonica]
MLNQRKHKKFNYQSRFSEENLTEKKNKHEALREVSSEWGKTGRTSPDRSKRITLPLLLLLLGIIIAILYYLET